MKKLLFGLILLSGMAWADDAHISDLSQGMVSYPSANKIPDNAAAYLQNVYTDVEPMAIERNGFLKRDTTVLGDGKQVSGMWSYVDTAGQDWVISFSSRSFYKNLSGVVPVKFGLTPTTDNVPQCTVNLGKIWCVNGADYLWWFDGSSTGAVTTAPLGRLIVPWRNRLAIGNIAGSLATVKISADGDGTNWTLGGNATDPFNILVSGSNDGQYIRCLYGSYTDNMIIFRKYDTWSMSGFSQADYNVRNISNEVGCIEQGSVREFDGSLIFLSARGLEEMKATTISGISEPIRDLIDPVIKNTTNQRVVVVTTNDDWNAGTVQTGNLYVNNSALNVPSSTFLQTTAADWSAGTAISEQGAYGGSGAVDTLTYPGDMSLVWPDPFDYKRDGTSGSYTAWSPNASCSGSAYTVSGGEMKYTNGGSGNCKVLVADQVYNLQVGTTFYMKINSIEGGTSNDGYFKIEDPTDTQKYFYIRFGRNTTDTSIGVTQIVYKDGTGSAVVVCSDITGCNGGYQTAPLTITIWLSTTTYSVTSAAFNKQGTHSLVNFDSPYLAYFRISNPTYTSEVVHLDKFSIVPSRKKWTSLSFDNLISSPIYSSFYANWTGTGTFTFSGEASSDGSSYDTPVYLSTGNSISMNRKRYNKINAFLSVTDPTGEPIRLSSMTFYSNSSGTYLSKVLDLGTAVSSLGIFTSNELVVGSATIAHVVCTSANSNMTSKTCASQINGLTVGAPVARYAQVLSTFSVVYTTDSATINDYSINYIEGNAPSIRSAVYDKRYWLSLTTNTGSSPYLDTVLLYQRNRTFSMLKGINAASFVNWRDKLYFGNSITNGYTYEFDSGFSDDSSPITTIIKTKSYDFGYFQKDKDFRQAYLSYLGNANYSGSFDLSYMVDRNTVVNSLGSANLNEGTGQVAIKFPFPLNTQPTQGREIQLQVTKTGTGDRLRLYNINLNYSVLEER